MIGDPSGDISGRDADLIRRVQLVSAHGLDEAGFWAWSTGEKLIVALVMGRSDVLDEMGWTEDEVVARWGAEIGFESDARSTRAWVGSLRLRAAVIPK